MEKITVTEVENYDSSLLQAIHLSSSASKPLFVLFTGSKNTNGRSWCPDCVTAEPIIMSELLKITQGCILLECMVDREEYRAPGYLYKTNSAKLKCVPTLHKFGPEGKSIASLNDCQSQNADLVHELIIS
jgi:thiol-disulfide isomerase/thioredoxin